MTLLRRKIDAFLQDWKGRKDHLPLIVKGARQIGKTASVSAFAKANYKHVVEINFVLEKKYLKIFDDGYDVDSIVKNISLINPDFVFEPYSTIVFFDELQHCPACATSLKAFSLDGRYDVVCSGSLMGINYQEIESNSVGYKEDYELHSMDFEEFLWATGYNGQQIEGWLESMKQVKPLTTVEMDVLTDLFRSYITLGGMPAVVSKYVVDKNFSGTLRLQRQLLKDYEEDITKYAEGMDKGRIKTVYNHIAVFLGQENKKFQITKLAHGARSREYSGTVDWLADAGIVNVCYCLDQVALPLKGNYNPRLFKVYFKDTGLLIASLDEEVQEDLRVNKNLNAYKGAIYENIVADMLVKQGYSLYFYKNDKSTVEMDFFVRDQNSLIPVEVKAVDNATRSLNKLIDDKEHFHDIRYGIKLCHKNIGFNGKFYTFPYFLAFLMRRYLRERQS